MVWHWHAMWYVACFLVCRTNLAPWPNSIKGQGNCSEGLPLSQGKLSLTAHFKILCYRIVAKRLALGLEVPETTNCCSAVSVYGCSLHLPWPWLLCCIGYDFFAVLLLFCCIGPWSCSPCLHPVASISDYICVIRLWLCYSPILALWTISGEGALLMHWWWACAHYLTQKWVNPLPALLTHCWWAELVPII